MIAVDAGFLYALADRRDRWHTTAMAHAPSVQDGWVTTWPLLAEACHLLGARLGPPYVAALLDDLAQLMRKYVGLPMDLADATLVLLAEHLGHGRILSTDLRDFGAYRWKTRKPFHNLLETPT